MTNSGDLGRGLAAELDADVEVEQVVIGSEKSTAAHRFPRRSPLSALALLAGVVFLIADIFVVARFPTWFFAKSVPATISLLLMLASLLAGLALIFYAVAQRRADREYAGGAGGYARAAGVPLLLALLAPLLAVWSLNVNKAANDRAVPKPCIDVYQQASAVAKDNPKFRMPAKDRDEVRCSVNAVLGR